MKELRDSKDWQDWEYKVQGGQDPKEGDDTIVMPGRKSPCLLRKIRRGTTILGYNRKTNATEPDDVAEIYEPSWWDSYCKVNGSRALLPIHQVLVRKDEKDDRGAWTDVSDLKLGQHLKLGNMTWEMITHLEQVDKVTRAHGFGVNPCEGYISNGVVVCVKKEYRRPRR